MLLAGPLYVLFAATGFLFWALLILDSILIIAAIENESPSAATATLFAGFAILWLFSDFSSRYAIHISWRIALAYCIGYAVCGVVWSCFKWYFKLSARRERWDEAVKGYKDLAGKNPPIRLDDPNFIDFFCRNYKYNDFVECHTFSTNRNNDKYRIVVKPKPDKTQIISWMVYWPWSLVWSLLDDVITNFFRWVYRQISGIYDGMANYMFNDVIEN